MSHYPGPRLEDWVRDAYIFPDDESYRITVVALKPVRKYVEEIVLPGFDADEESWRSYRNDRIAAIEEAADPFRIGILIAFDELKAIAYR